MKKHIYILLTILLIGFVRQQLSAQAKSNLTGILGAFPPEVELVHNLIENKKEIIIQNHRFTEGMLKGRHVVLAQTGIGKVNAAITTTLMLDHFKPDELLFTGIAGGVDPALSPGDLVIGDKVAYHDYGVVVPDSMIVKPTHDPDYNTDNPIYFPCTQRLVLLAKEVGKHLKLEMIGTRTPKIVTGTIVTGDVFMASDKAAHLLQVKMNAEATEMEGAAVAQTCWQQKVPFLVIRSLSDNASNTAHADVAAFYKVAADNSANMVIALVALLSSSRN